MMDNKQELELFKTLGRIETKMEGMCAKNLERHQEVKELSKVLHDSFKHLPCATQYKSCQDDIKKKLSWSTMIVILGFVFTLITGSYAYTLITEQHIGKHSENTEIHFMMPDEKPHPPVIVVPSKK